MLGVAVTFIVDLQVLNAGLESLDLILVLLRLLVALGLEMLELHVDPLVLTCGVLSLLVESSLEILKGFTLAVELGLNVGLLSCESISLLLGVTEELFLVSLQTSFGSLLTLFELLTEVLDSLVLEVNLLP